MRIKKVSQTTPTQAQIINEASNSTTDAYSADYVNKNLIEVVPFRNIFTPATGFNIEANSTLFKIGKLYFGWVGVQGTVSTTTSNTNLGTVNKYIVTPTAMTGQASESQWNPGGAGAILYLEGGVIGARVSTAAESIRWFFCAELSDS